MTSEYWVVLFMSKNVLHDNLDVLLLLKDVDICYLCQPI